MSTSKIYFIDAGVENIKIIKKSVANGSVELKKSFFNNDELLKLLDKEGLLDELQKEKESIFATGKLANTLIKKLAGGQEISSSAALWAAAKKYAQEKGKAVGIVELSASGYMVIGVDGHGDLYKDTLTVNPRCGAGSGTNLSRVLQKLDIDREKVDEVLAAYLGDKGKEERKKVSIRADRCGVFSSSATISDKNQGIPLSFALATTLKSEVLKACRKMPAELKTIYLTGGVFRWQYARDCASDYYEEMGAEEILWRGNESVLIEGMEGLIQAVGTENFRRSLSEKLSKEEKFSEYKPFAQIKSELEESSGYLRFGSGNPVLPSDILDKALNIGLDIGSTMAKLAIADAETDEIVYLSSFDNHGDTIETVKHIFRKLISSGLNNLKIQNIGITGSGRYQVQKVLSEVYPGLSERIIVLVENYAHARGSIAFAKERIAHLKSKGLEVNSSFFTLVDVGGEDTKISVISLRNDDLYDNAMNLKCSAGTGSLMDTLRSMFAIDSVKTAAEKAMAAEKAYSINATCAVFLMENARKLQLSGYEQGEILASCYWAIVENMSRTLWSQVDIPKNSLVLLHGQTMLSDPLPLACMDRLKENLGNVYGVVPPHPGHRACLGLIKSLDKRELRNEGVDLNLFLDREFERKIFVCRGASCGDANASCARSLLSFIDNSGKTKIIALGGCSSVNEMEAKRQIKSVSNQRKDAYQKIWRHLEDALPKSDDENRLVIPRSFAISEQAYFFSQFFGQFGIPVHVDSVKASDVIEAQPLFNIDTCAPVIGATGQFIRLANEKHGFILVPQIDYLFTDGKSIGKTCTTNQGGVLVAMQYAKKSNPEASFHFFDISFQENTADHLAAQLEQRLGEIWQKYNTYPNREEIRAAVDVAQQKAKSLRERIASQVSDMLLMAKESSSPIVIAVGREYILNPGVYDSHVGRLFGDKGVTVIPGWALDIGLEKEFADTYWRNPHFILSLIRAAKDRKLAQMLRNPLLAETVGKIENDKDFHIGLAVVSTFRCGPDSMILPVIQEVAKDSPFLVIQSDAAINELAHLENRVNTYLNQLKANLKSGSSLPSFRFEVLEKFSAKTLDKEKDVLYFPTLEDNRMLSAVMRAAGFSCPDNYSSRDYDLERIARLGRKYAGDTVCTPFAAVFGDTIVAMRDFLAKKASGKFSQKHRLVIFNNRGEGPCRQGQYFNIHKLLLHKEFLSIISKTKTDHPMDMEVAYIVGEEKSAYNFNLESWTLAQAFYSIVVQGILHQIMTSSGARIKSFHDYKSFLEDFEELKTSISKKFEYDTVPSPKWKKLKGKFPNGKFLDIPETYFGSGLYKKNGLVSLLNDFVCKWPNSGRDEKLRIFVEGEAYMRVAQIPQVFRALVDSLGFDNFNLDYSPLWLYFEYITNEGIMNEWTYLKTHDSGWKSKLQSFKKILSLHAAIFVLRNVLAKPLYKAAGLEMPKKMSRIIKLGQRISSSAKPAGELIPFLGEGIEKLNRGYDLFLNVAPEGCMVASMGEMLSESIKTRSEDARPEARTQGLFSSEGELDMEKLQLAILKVMGPEKFYSR